MNKRIRDTDVILQEPDHHGMSGKAWFVPKKKADPTCGIGCWLVECPNAHPVWHSYLFSVAHLRPAKGVSKPLTYLHNATHEFLLIALNPEASRRRLLEVGKLRPLDAMTPYNFGAQMSVANDELALAKVRDSVVRVVNGLLHPDSDFVSDWVAIFGDNMLRDRR